MKCIDREAHGGHSLAFHHFPSPFPSSDHAFTSALKDSSNLGSPVSVLCSRLPRALPSTDSTAGPRRGMPAPHQLFYFSKTGNRDPTTRPRCKALPLWHACCNFRGKLQRVCFSPSDAAPWFCPLAEDTFACPSQMQCTELGVGGVLPPTARQHLGSKPGIHLQQMNWGKHFHFAKGEEW